MKSDLDLTELALKNVAQLSKALAFQLRLNAGFLCIQSVVVSIGMRAWVPHGALLSCIEGGSATLSVTDSCQIRAVMTQA